MRGLDFGIGLVVLAVVAATVALVVISSRDSTPQATAQDTTATLTTAASPKGCATTTAQLSSDTTLVPERPPLPAHERGLYRNRRLGPYKQGRQAPRARSCGGGSCSALADRPD